MISAFLLDKSGRVRYSLALLVFMATLFTSLTFLTVSDLSALTAKQWQIIDFDEHGTRRVVDVDQNRWFFYRSEPNRELIANVEGGKIKIMAAVRDNSEELVYQIRINNAFRSFRVTEKDSNDPFNIMENVYLNLEKGIHQLRISTSNRLAYFKLFREDEIWTVPTTRQPFIPDNFHDRYHLISADSESVYYATSATKPIEFRVNGPNNIAGFTRFIADDMRREGFIDVFINSQKVETIEIPSRLTGSYQLKELPGAELSIGRRFDFNTPAGENTVRLVPRDDRVVVFRLIKDVPDASLFEPDPDNVYEVSLFNKPSVVANLMSKLDLTTGLAIRYSDNVFSLSESDRERFDQGSSALSFIDSADDLVFNPYLRGRYTMNFGNYTLTPYFNFNYYHYTQNNDKSNYSILTGLFNSFGIFNVNLYYGYYADLYVRDYVDLDGTGEYENFTYEKNLYRLYSFFRLGRFDTPLLYFQVEDYFHGEHFTEYDGTATTYGLGWRRSFPTFYLRFFYYYREFVAANTDYDIDSFSLSDRITDPQYESNIYDLQIRNKLIPLSDKIQMRPFIGFRFEDRFYTTKLPVQVSPFQSTRNDRRYRLNIGSEFVLTPTLTATAEYSFFLRDSHSDNDTVIRLKDYNQQSVSLDFAYRLSF